MTGNNENAIYDTFEEYISYKDALDRIKGNISSQDIEALYDNSLFIDKENKKGIITDCLRMRDYILRFYSKNNNCCVYMNYWLNKLVRTAYKRNTSIFDIFRNYMNQEIKLKPDNPCTYKINYMDEYTYQNIYQLYFMYDQYKHFKKNGKAGCHQAVKCAETYNKIVGDCHKLGKGKNCKVLENFKTDFENNEIISKEQCNQKIPKLLIPANSFIPPQVPSDRRDSEEQDASVHVAGTLDASSDTLQKGELETHSTPHSYTPLGSVIPIIIFSAFSGIMILILILYKFTPFGNVLRSRTIKNERSLNILEKYYELPEHNSEENQRNLEFEIYNLAYHSS
ncbi:Plasmodium vivax Vir protein/Plasmodium variant antigen protein Cir/Yir/Bir, putative [Plasmodium ovale]|uniref:Plasmodium vivax Vir protein/Plasmodium variant antigen protein Cir/Yir/Bir, putative n=1 Tax=Plasmodium ovale TaxID=36330 RepID=A0A1C3KGP9_PLAOA|nr:Plasmodium vivax Vir protein/Plasmodium variant antigen protein Cir/Yir/Bir, putative [Plasmodium ovale]